MDFDPEDETEFDLFQNLVALRDITASLTVKMKKGIEEALKNAPPEEGTKNYNM